MIAYPLPTIIELSVAELHDVRQIGLIASGPALASAERAGLQLPAIWRSEPGTATEQHFATLARACPLAVEVIYAVGGGLAADAAKYVAHARNLPLVVIPTALSVDAHLTWACGVRRAGCVFYLETGAPQLLYADLDLLAAAPPQFRAAGLCDLLSIATGLWDWQYAEAHGQNPAQQRYVAWAATQAQAILDGALRIAAAAGAGDREGLRALLHLLALEVQLCNLLGHSRPEEGSEHYLAYALESDPAIGAGHAHGDLVGPAILFIARAQGQDPEPLQEALAAAGVPLNRIPHSLLESTAQRLPGYVREHGLAYGIGHTLR